MYSKPVAYFITFTTHGSWLHGDPRNSIIRDDGIPKLITANTRLYQHKQAKLKSPPVYLNKAQRIIVLETIVQHCRIRQWQLPAAHVRSNHVHILVRADQDISKVMNELKAWSTRKLRQEGHNIPKVWTVGGSKRYVFTDAKLREKIHYVIHEQGRMKQHYLDKEFR